MAENILKTRIQLKYDTYENWQQSEIILKKGEIAIVEIPDETEGSQLTPPAIGIKVGDGTNAFSSLSWIQAIAGDVATWAKATNKPTYTAQEITGLEEFISGEISDTNTQYQIVADEEAHTYKLQKKDIGEEVYSDVASSTVDLSEIYTQLESFTTSLAEKQDKLEFMTAYNSETNKVATKSDIDTALQGLSGALKFKGTKESLPEDTSGYEDGDVIFVQNKEYVCESKTWRELGDETSFAVKGSIKDSDIAEGANIAQSKIAGLEDALANAGTIKKITVNGTDVTVNEEKTAEIKLAEIAINGEVKNLKQTDDTILVFNCGSSTTVI